MSLVGPKGWGSGSEALCQMSGVLIPFRSRFGSSVCDQHQRLNSGTGTDGLNLRAADTGTDGVDLRAADSDTDTGTSRYASGARHPIHRGTQLE